MRDEPSARRTEFQEGRRVRLADGQFWSLPIRDPTTFDPQYDSLLHLMHDSEDRADWLKNGLALTIMLLTRNYDLSPTDLAELLTFNPADSDLDTLQTTIGRLADEALARLRVAPPEPDNGRWLREALLG